MSANLQGIDYRIVGRVVLGEKESGTVYYWNEFNLVTPSGATAILVFEEAEAGPQWRLFAMFEPEYPISPGDAAGKVLGSVLNFDGTDVRVTFIGESRIYHIEGQGAEGEDVGDVARYFNAEGSNNKFVVSWTGDEVEVYRGFDIPRNMVRTAFKLASDVAPNLRSGLTPQGAPSRYRVLPLLIFLAFIGVLAFFFFGGFRHSARPLQLINAVAPPELLQPGNILKADGTAWRIGPHSKVEIRQVGLNFMRHEYALADEHGKSAILLYGYRPGAGDWMLLTPLHPSAPITATQAATRQVGDTIALDGISARVTSLFLTTPVQIDGSETSAPDLGGDLYGFTAQAGDYLLFARWNNGGIQFFLGEPIKSKDLASK